MLHGRMAIRMGGGAQRVGAHWVAIEICYMEVDTELESIRAMPGGLGPEA